MISNWDIADLYDLVAGDLDCAAGALAAGADGAPAAVAIIDGGADRDWNRRQARWMLLRYALAPADPPPAKPSPADPLATRRLEDRVIRLRLSWMPPAADLSAYVSRNGRQDAAQRLRRAAAVAPARCRRKTDYATRSRRQRLRHRRVPVPVGATK